MKKLSKSQKEYIEQVEKELDPEETIAEHIINMEYNYVVLDGGGINTPLRFFDGSVVVYADRNEAVSDSREGDLIVTEKEYFDSLGYETSDDDEYDGHDDRDELPWDYGKHFD